MAVRFALALEASTDELFGLAGSKAARGKKPNRKILRLMEQILMLGIVHQGIAYPIVWLMLPKNTRSNCSLLHN